MLKERNSFLWNQPFLSPSPPFGESLTHLLFAKKKMRPKIEENHFRERKFILAIFPKENYFQSPLIPFCQFVRLERFLSKSVYFFSDLLYVVGTRKSRNMFQEIFCKITFCPFSPKTVQNWFLLLKMEVFTFVSKSVFGYFFLF